MIVFLIGGMLIFIQPGRAGLLGQQSNDTQSFNIIDSDAGISTTGGGPELYGVSVDDYVNGTYEFGEDVPYSSTPSSIVPIPPPEEEESEPGPEDPGPVPPPEPEPEPCPSDGWVTTDTYDCSVCDGDDICTTCKDQEYRDYPPYEPCDHTVTATRTIHTDCSAHCGDDICNCGEDAASCPADCNEPPYTENYDVEEPTDNQFCRASKGEIVVDYVPKWIFKDDNDDYNDTMQAYKIQLEDEAGNRGKKEVSGLDIPDGETVTHSLEVRTDDRLTSDPDESLHLEYNQDYDWRVDVQDSIGAWSGWSGWQSFSVKPHYPNAQFSYAPDGPSINTEVNFDATDSEVFDGTQAQLSWDFDGDGAWEINNTTDKTATYSYDETGEYTVILRVEDNSPETSACFEEKEIKVKPKQGPREEVIPR